MSEPLLTKDAINLGGHKFPIALVGALAAVAGVVLVMRARSQGGQIASIGTSPDLAGYSAGVAGQTDAAQLANLQLQLSNIQQQLSSAPPAGTPTPVPTPVPPVATGLPPPPGTPGWFTWWNSNRGSLVGPPSPILPPWEGDSLLLGRPAPLR